MIRRAADHRVDVLLLKAFPPVHILLGVGELPRPEVQVVLVDVAEGHHVLGGHPAEMGLTSAPGADEGNVEFVAGGVRSEEPNFREDKAGRTAEGHAFEKLASFHCAIIDHLSPGVKQTYRHYQAHRDATTGTPDSSGSPAAVRGLPDESGVPVSLAAQTSRLIDASSDFPSAEQERALCTRRSVTSFQPCIPKHNVLLWDSRLGPPLQERSPRQPYGRHARHSTDTRRG